jgi:hypothetical protein
MSFAVVSTQPGRRPPPAGRTRRSSAGGLDTTSRTTPARPHQPRGFAITPARVKLTLPSSSPASKAVSPEQIQSALRVLQLAQAQYGTEFLPEAVSRSQMSASEAASLVLRNSGVQTTPAASEALRLEHLTDAESPRLAVRSVAPPAGAKDMPSATDAALRALSMSVEPSKGSPSRPRANAAAATELQPLVEVSGISESKDALTPHTDGESGSIGSWAEGGADLPEVFRRPIEEMAAALSKRARAKPPKPRQGRPPKGSSSVTVRSGSVEPRRSTSAKRPTGRAQSIPPSSSASVSTAEVVVSKGGSYVSSFRRSVEHLRQEKEQHHHQPPAVAAVRRDEDAPGQAEAEVRGYQGVYQRRSTMRHQHSSNRMSTNASFSSVSPSQSPLRKRASSHGEGPELEGMLPPPPPPRSAHSLTVVHAPSQESSAESAASLLEQSLRTSTESTRLSRPPPPPPPMAPKHSLANLEELPVDGESSSESKEQEEEAGEERTTSEEEEEEEEAAFESPDAGGDHEQSRPRRMSITRALGRRSVVRGRAISSFGGTEEFGRDFDGDDDDDGSDTGDFASPRPRPDVELSEPSEGDMRASPIPDSHPPVPVEPPTHPSPAVDVTTTPRPTVITTVPSEALPSPPTGSLPAPPRPWFAAVCPCCFPSSSGVPRATRPVSFN